MEDKGKYKEKLTSEILWYLGRNFYILVPTRMEDCQKLFLKWKTTSNIFQLEDDLNFWDMAVNLNFIHLEEDLNFLANEGNLIIFNWKTAKNLNEATTTPPA